MANAMYYQRGETLDYRNEGSDVIKAGTIIKIGKRIGIAGDDISPKMLGSLHVSGVFEFEKTSVSEIKMGTTVYFDDTGITEVEGANNLAGFAAESVEASAGRIKVKIG